MSVQPFGVGGGAPTGPPGLRVDLPAVHRELDRRVAGLELLPEPVQPGGAEPADAAGLGQVEDVAEDGRLRAGDVRPDPALGVDEEAAAESGRAGRVEA